MLPQVQKRVQDSIEAGVWSRSSEIGDYEYVIFASDIPFAETVNYLEDKGISFKDLVGSYVMRDTGERVEEQSFIVNKKHFDAIRPLIVGQESVLVLAGTNSDNTRNARLLFLKDGTSESVGVMRSVSKDYALTQDYWTYDPYTKTYYVAE